MKKIFFTLIILIAIFSIFFYLNQASFSPLKEKEFKILFPNYHGVSKKMCDVDFLGLSLHDELFDYFSYKMDNVYIDTSYPKYRKEWEHNEFISNTTFSKWKKCPIDSSIFNLYEFNLLKNKFDEKDCSNSFSKELYNSKNYYSYVYFSELENYFLIYNIETKTLSYIRRKGF